MALKRVQVLSLALAIVSAIGALVFFESSRTAVDWAGTPDSLLRAQDKILDEWRIQDRSSDVRTPLYFLSITGMFKQFALKNFPSIKGLTIAEIGPGSSLLPGALFVSAGAKHFYGIDLYQHPGIYNALTYRVGMGLAYVDRDYGVRKASEIILREENGNAVLNPEHITFLNRQSYDTSLPDESVDFLYSMAVIEHLDDPERSIREWMRVLKPGGISAHYAALADHRDFTKPYEYLKFEPAEWKAKFGQGKQYRAYEFVNSWRAIDFFRAFEKAGFQVLVYGSEPPHPLLKEQVGILYPTRTMNEETWSQIAPSIRKGRTREEVGQIIVTLVAMKPAAGKAH